MTTTNKENLWSEVISKVELIFMMAIMGAIHFVFVLSSETALLNVSYGEGMAPGVLYGVFTLPWYYVLLIFVLIVEVIYWLIPRSYYLDRNSDDKPMISAFIYKLKILWSIALAFPLAAVLADLFKGIFMSCNNLILTFAAITKDQWLEMAKGLSFAVVMVAGVILFIWMNSFKMRFKGRKIKR